ncbi:MAG: chorismate synthase [Tissierellia bacterium]|nr:chorismate synthase [Tissierellia bacterium]
MFEINIFGESHAKGVGATVNGIRAGFEIDYDKLNLFMKRRKAVSSLTTARKEKDEVVFLSGVTNGITNGFPITVFIENKNVRKEDYNKYIPRPSHADFAAISKFGYDVDISGGGFFSARLTAALVALGFIVKEILKLDYNINIYSHIKQIYDIEDMSFYDLKTKDLELIQKKDIEIIDDRIKNDIIKKIKNAKAQKDSLSSSIEVMATGVKAGIGGLFLKRADVVLSSFLFAIPAVKAVSFGKDFKNTKGSLYNDNFEISNGEVKLLSNNQAGITGGITNGEDIIATIDLKPTPSIAKEQRSVDLKEKKNVSLKIKGRHDPCVGLRAPVIAESMMAFAIMDLISG